MVELEVLPSEFVVSLSVTDVPDASVVVVSVVLEDDPSEFVVSVVVVMELDRSISISRRSISICSFC